MRWEKLNNGRFALWDGWVLRGEVQADPDGEIHTVWVIARGRDPFAGSWKPGPKFATIELAKKWVEDEVKIAEIGRLA